MIGLKIAVMVVGGWDNGVLLSCSDEEGRSWKDGGVASGIVEKRIPVETT